MAKRSADAYRKLGEAIGAKQARIGSVVAQCTWCDWRSSASNPLELVAHLKTCARKPIQCPMRLCDHQCLASDMVDHLREKHREGIGRVVVCLNPKSFLVNQVEREDFPHSMLMPVAGSFMLVMDRKVRDGMFTAKAIHFDEPKVYKLHLKAGDCDEVYIKGKSTHIKNVDDEPNIKLPMILFERFFDVVVPGGNAARLTISSEQLGS
eukprot:TRINITY_DN50455_c0_g1_i1.p1 TRINITY_DN50455_c0_g1~~TRINITY_DN50455_c0_g1_i1.p1  ORF type:complete len:219 (-),score=23.33 TRINITY_DN50455_c0_g1_i1:219-842(-)